MNTRTLSLNELNRHAVAALIREIGVAGTLRFLGQLYERLGKLHLRARSVIAGAE